ncbi:N-acetylmuramic acid 6-phosphate etherase [Shimia sp. SK013]|uniref:N-acetylmuramic acid 6-phosphate etherase n=1 Tax=Shimia sp. SK013 TaxID=1389006 RepID=UPI0006B68511|nr:N-acetylmuramic acid 6-phosphate etherase [Shimia sp. SK013]KPA20709.1 N-acetylmuramic acid 6-phosphate etherase [Shimia sp. SK013]
MPVKVTEQCHQDAAGLDIRAPSEAALLMSEVQIQAAASTKSALNEIGAGGDLMAATIASGATLHYVAAGSSGLMAAADALELGGTFSIPAHQIRIHMAGGMPQGVEMPGDTEDSTRSLHDGLSGLGSADTVIAVSASGSTPFTIAAAQIARTAGAKVIGVANNPGSELLLRSDVAICLETPPEVISGSTRLGAATAQKIALNIMSTLMAIRLGHVHDGMMVNLHADNAKLRDRAKNIVATIAQTTTEEAAEALEAAGGHVKTAVLLVSGAASFEHAHRLLKEAGGHLRTALQQIR